MRRYTAYRFLYPPRPKVPIFASELARWEHHYHYVAQFKKNGSGGILAIAPDRSLITRRRDNTAHKAWTPSERTRRAFADLPGGGWYVFVAEVLHSKVRGLRDINFINDILVHDGDYLVGTTFEHRQQLLGELFDAAALPVASTGGHYLIDDCTWLARNHPGGFARLFEGLTAAEDEGLVLKDPAAKLAPCLAEYSNSSWQVKCRKPTKSYAY